MKNPAPWLIKTTLTFLTVAALALLAVLAVFFPVALIVGIPIFFIVLIKTLIPLVGTLVPLCETIVRWLSITTIAVSFPVLIIACLCLQESDENPFRKLHFAWCLSDACRDEVRPKRRGDVRTRPHTRPKRRCGGCDVRDRTNDERETRRTPRHHEREVQTTVPSPPDPEREVRTVTPPPQRHTRGKKENWATVHDDADLFGSASPRVRRAAARLGTEFGFYVEIHTANGTSARTLATTAYDEMPRSAYPDYYEGIIVLALTEHPTDAVNVLYTSGQPLRSIGDAVTHRLPRLKSRARTSTSLAIDVLDALYEESAKRTES